MKKKNLKSLKLNKRSISNLEKRNAVGGQEGSISIIPCWSIISCPTVQCTDPCSDGCLDSIIVLLCPIPETNPRCATITIDL